MDYNEDENWIKEVTLKIRASNAGLEFEADAAPE